MLLILSFWAAARRQSIVPSGDGIDDLLALDVSDQHSHKKPACSVNPRIPVFHQTPTGLVCQVSVALLLVSTGTRLGLAVVESLPAIG